ncbi:MAG TPA: glycine--tRNA ligase subunit beta [Trichormus sp.]|jgi:glycyl-tRNA synthetase beta chain
MADYLLEIGTEELPAGYIPDAQKNLQQLLSDALRSANLSFNEIRTLSTPRRLTAIVSGLSEKQETVQKKVKGPPVKSSFDEDGQPKPAAVGFAKKNGLSVTQLDYEGPAEAQYLIANLTIEGKPAEEVLLEIVPKAITQLPGERQMRWGANEMKFSRPIRWIVSLLNDKIVPVTLEGITADRHSAGHRILSQGRVKISNAAHYVDELRAAHVLVDPQERKRIIEEQVSRLAKDKSGTPRQLKGSLLEEVVNITEWPHAIAGDFATDYLDLPDTLIETVMVHHQRYFAIEKANADHSHRAIKNNLLPHFITVANNDSAQAQHVIKRGNEQVLKARLADGKFFYLDDQKTKLADRKEGLKQLMFQEGLGSYADKVDRLQRLAAIVSQQLKLHADLAAAVSTTAGLCKLDLVSNLVRELPELQGYVGAWYAEKENMAPEVVTAIGSHYSPRSTDDSIPKDTVGMLVSAIDKIDTLVGLFALGKKPSGSSDPFALRRQAQGLIDILLDGLKSYPLNLTAVIRSLLDWLEPSLKGSKRGFDADRIHADLQEFLMQRLQGKLQDQGVGREVIDAVLGARDPFTNLPDVRVRCTCVENLMAAAGGLDLVRAGVRVGKILGADSPDIVDPSLFVCDAERKLWDTFNQTVINQWQSGNDFVVPQTSGQYERLLDLLKPLSPSVDQFFEQVMVNDEDRGKRNNRHGMLKQIDRYFRSVADFPKLQSLLV